MTELPDFVQKQKSALLRLEAVVHALEALQRANIDPDVQLELTEAGIAMADEIIAANANFPRPKGSGGKI